MKMQLLLRGFTLIEVLVVITIISILVAVLTANFSDARVDSKNKAFQSEIKELQLALELYKAQYGRYPAANCDNDGDAGRARALYSNCAIYIQDVIPDYIAALPVNLDGPNGDCEITYRVATDGSWYKLIGDRCLGGIDSAADGISTSHELARCPTTCAADGDTDKTCNSTNYTTYSTSVDFYESIAVYSAGGQCW
jgi:prepilin-type N-terminal cleavage/methylation domain-containing protein